MELNLTLNSQISYEKMRKIIASMGPRYGTISHLNILLPFLIFFFFPLTPLLLIESFESESENVWMPAVLSFSSCKAKTKRNSVNSRDRKDDEDGLQWATTPTVCCWSIESVRKIYLHSYSEERKFKIVDHHTNGPQIFPLKPNKRIAYLETVLKT